MKQNISTYRLQQVGLVAGMVLGSFWLFFYLLDVASIFSGWWEGYIANETSYSLTGFVDSIGWPGFLVTVISEALILAMIFYCFWQLRYMYLNWHCGDPVCSCHYKYLHRIGLAIVLIQTLFLVVMALGIFLQLGTQNFEAYMPLLMIPFEWEWLAVGLVGLWFSRNIRNHIDHFRIKNGVV